MLSRFVNNNTEISKRYCVKTITDLKCSYLGCCKECLNQAEEFCNVYHQFKCLELQLEWKIYKLVNIIKLANKVPSRVLEVKKVLQDNHENDKRTQDIKDENINLRVVQSFRQQLTKICRRKVKKSQPRVLVKNDAQLLLKHNHQDASVFIGNNACHDKDEVKAVASLPDTTIISKPEHDHPIDPVDEDVHTQVQITNASSTNGMVTSMDTQIDNPDDASIDAALNDDPVNFFDEETFEDLNINDPLDDIGNHDAESAEQANILLVEKIPHVNESIPTPVYVSSLTVPENISNINSELYPTSFNTENVSTCTSLQSSQDQPVEYKYVAADSLDETLTNQPTILNTKPTPQNICQQNDIQQDEHPKIIQCSRTHSQQKRYNLRQNRVTKYVTQSADNDSENEFARQTFSSRSSSTSSSSYDDEEVPEEKAIPKFNFDRVQNPGSFISGYYPCLVVGCEEIYSTDRVYQTHLKLHKPGSYLCIFCERVKTDVIKLGKHEYKFHSKIQPDLNLKSDRRSNPWACPRCSYQSTCNLDYDTHFAYAHFGIGDNPDSPSLPFKIRRTRRPKIINTRIQIVECETCKKKIRRFKMPLHFTKFHDLTKIDPKDIQRCDEDNCSAYFLKREQLLRHYNSEHGIQRRALRKKIKKDQIVHEAALHPKRNISMGKFINCEICNKKVWEQQKQKHFKMYHDTTDSTDIKKCIKDNCQAYFLTEDQLKSHLISQHEKLFRCGRCERFFPTHILLYRHYREKHKKNIKSVKTMKNSEGHSIIFSCTFCESKTKSPKTLALHESRKHATSLEQDASTQNQLKIHICSRCPFKYKREMRYLGHFLNDHLNIPSEKCPDACKMCSSGKIYVANTHGHFNNLHNTDFLDDPTNVFKCDFNECPAYFLKSIQLHCHRNKIHPILKCLRCVKTFKSRRKLLDHLRKCQTPCTGESHPNLGVACDNPSCTVQFHSKEEMEAHKIYAHPKKPKPRKEKTEICPICEKRFNTVRRLRYHMKVGHVERSVICSECGNVFKSQCHLDIHMVFHKGPDEWEYQCSECGKKCFNKQKLEEHFRTHTKEKPFVCQFCGGKYAHRHNWRNHLKTKHADEEGVDEIVGKGKKGNYLSRKGSRKGECIIGNNGIA